MIEARCAVDCKIIQDHPGLLLRVLGGGDAFMGAVVSARVVQSSIVMRAQRSSPEPRKKVWIASLRSQ
jgi:hypothetical protein